VIAPKGEIRVDLLSDTVTLPPPEMREAMTRAELGDDVYGEDPTVRRLEEEAAERLGKEAAIFVPSGTMGNLLALLAHCPRGRKVLVGDRSDIWLWEAGGAAVLGGLTYHPLPTGEDGEISLEDLAAAIPDLGDPECAPPGAICLESTHCLCGGRPLRLDYLQRVWAFAREHGLPVPLDGARLFNAALALGVPAAEIARYADSIMFCLSKGLSAPVGSLVAGDGELVVRVRRLRKMLGGGMRQAGVLAAAGLYALERMVDRLAEDHENARRLFLGLREIPGIVSGERPPESNIVFFETAVPGLSASAFLAALAERGVRAGELGQGRIRAVTHYGIGAEEVELALRAIRESMTAFHEEIR